MAKNSLERFLSSLSLDRNVRGRQFEQFVRWYLLNEPYWAGLVRSVWLWREFPGRWGADCGVDLVFEDKDSRLWAVQAKCYTESYSITKADLDTFLSESNRPSIYGRLLVSTTDLISGNGLQVCDAQEKVVLRLMRSHLKESAIGFPENVSMLESPAVVEKPKPRPYQAIAVKDVCTRFSEETRGQLIMACGTGKTFTTLWVKEALNARRTLVLLPSLGLLSQTLREWNFAANTAFASLCVCSDQTTGRGDEDFAVARVSDIPFPVVQDSESVSTFIAHHESCVVFSTYQSSSVVAAAYRQGDCPPFDLVVYDEAHRCAGISNGQFSLALGEDWIRAKKRLFTTATPKVFGPSIKKSSEEVGSILLSMDDRRVFGEVFHRLSFGDAIKEGLLTDYRVVIVGVSAREVLDHINRRTFLRVGEEEVLDAESFAIHHAVLKAINKYRLRRVITFHGRVQKAKTFASDLEKFSKGISLSSERSVSLHCDHVNGDMPTFQRKQKLRLLQEDNRDACRLITNSRCLSEGIDVPSLDAVCFIDPRRSEIDIVQAIGRAIRLSPEKSYGYILLPLFILEGEDADSALGSSTYSDIAAVLNALRAHDESFGQDAAQLRMEMGRRNLVYPTRGIEKCIIDLPSAVPPSFHDRLSCMLVESLSSSWDKVYGRLLARIEEVGRSAYREPIFSDWVVRQRVFCRKAKLLSDRKDRLEHLPFWSWDPNEEEWWETYYFLENYSVENGARSAPDSLVDERGVRLNTWIKSNRKSYLAGVLTGDRIAALEKLPDWTWSPLEDARERGYRAIEKYLQRVGFKPTFPADYVDEDGYPVTEFANALRTSYKRGKLSPEAIDRISRLKGWAWNVESERWMSCFAAVRHYVEQHNSLDLPRDMTDEWGVTLYSWLKTQRTRHKKRLMPEDQRLLLESLPFWSWNPKTTNWEKNYNTLKANIEFAFQAPNQSGAEGGWTKELKTWVSSQRESYRLGKLSKDRTELLQTIPGWNWNANDSSWVNGISELKQFAESNSLLRLTRTTVTSSGFPLGTWVHTKRNEYRRGALSKERIVAFESVPGWVWNVQESIWHANFAALTTYCECGGDLLKIPAGHTVLGVKIADWAMSQRQAYQNGTLDEKKVRLLNGLSGWVWDVRATLWESGFRILCDYHRATGTAAVPSGYETDEAFRLGRWVGTQRQEFKKGRLAPERAMRLEQLTGWRW